MSLEIRKTSKWWYGRWMKDGKRHCSKLPVEVVGNPGEADHEESRKAAHIALEQVKAGERQRNRPEDLVQEIHRVKFGHKIGAIPLSHLFEAWQNIPRKRQPKERYLKWAGAVFNRFLAYIKAEFPRVKEMSAVDKKVSEGFMRHEAARKISPRTFNAELVLLRGAFEHLREDAGMLTNPFRKIVTKDKETVHRKPFTQEELTALIDAARDVEFMYPLVVIGACTAMRRGDCCLLKWPDVDLTNRYVRVKTSKTGGSVEIPMFAMLEDLLREMEKSKAKGPYVMPELAEIYRKNPCGVNWRLKQVFTKAGFMDADEYEKLKKKSPGTEIVHRGEMHAFDETRGRAVCVRGFHSFRVTWITLALAAGVPMELVTRVTGHQTVDVVLKHYFRPGREEFRHAIEVAMPKMLTGGNGQADKTPNPPSHKAAADLRGEVLEICGKATAKTWKKDMARIAELVAAI